MFPKFFDCHETENMNPLLDLFLCTLLRNFPKFSDLCAVQRPMNLVHSVWAIDVVESVVCHQKRLYQKLLPIQHRSDCSNAMDEFLNYQWMRCDHLDANPTNKIPCQNQCCPTTDWLVQLSNQLTENKEEKPIELFFYRISFSIILSHWITSFPLCCALQLLMLNEPLMKSFWTSTTKNALIGRTIWNVKKKTFSFPPLIGFFSSTSVRWLFKIIGSFDKKTKKNRW